MTDRHPTANASQRARRDKLARVDYYPSREALGVMAAKRTNRYPLNVHSGILDAILLEWAELTGLVVTPAEPAGIYRHQCARANDSGSDPAWMKVSPERKQPALPDRCGARTKAGTPCRA